jgi:AAA15 family ATPase/GTPase
MLIEFTLSNSRSIRGKQSLSLTKAKGDELADSNSFEPGAEKVLPLLRSCAIYGPNASGKSNLLLALSAMRKVVVDSATDSQRGDLLPVTPFYLNSAARAQPTELEVTFIADGIRYQYGFTATTERIMEEWLFAYPLGRPQRWIGRVWNAQENTYQWDKMSALSGQKQVWQESTRDNALFLSTAVQLNCQQLQPVYDWFRRTLKMAGVGGWDSSFTASLCKSSGTRQKVLDFLRAADLDIHDVSVEAEKLSAKHLPSEMSEEAKTKILENMKDQEIFDIKTVHLDDQKQPVFFEFDEESHGTRKLFSFAGPWLDSLASGNVLVIDELHDNLHPKLVEFLVALFHNNETNPKNAQLIFTTHDTSILSQDVFRRDQIWFCEKNSEQETQLYPLTDFSPRKGRENLEVAYLAGRYGALPYLRSIQKSASIQKQGAT